MTEIYFIALILSTALLMGNEFSIASFIHPSLSRADQKRHLPAIQIFAKLFGRVMPFWMAGTAIAHLAITWALWTTRHGAALLTLYAAFIWIFVILISVIFLVPINNRVGKWETSTLPPNWESERRRWDIYNIFRVACIGVAFVLLVLAYGRSA